MDDPLRSMKVGNPIIEKLGEANALIEPVNGQIRLISHYDGDGICSAGIISRALYRKGKRFHATMTSVVTKEYLDSIKQGHGLLIFTDMGSNLVKDISNKAMELGIRAIILDHHEVGERTAPYSISDGSVHEINPRFHGVNGTNGCSGSTLSFLLSLAMDPGNTDLAVYGLAGALTDKQSVPEFSELNLAVKNLAIERCGMTPLRGIPLWGETVHEALHLSNEPFIKGISGDPKKAEEVLRLLRIDPVKKPSDLTRDELKSLHSYLFITMLKSGIDPDIVNEVFRDDLRLKDGRTVSDIGYAIDTCGRDDQMSLGFAVVWGGEDPYKKAYGIRTEARKKVQSKLFEIIKNGSNDMENVQWIDVEEEKLAGTIAGLSHNYLLDPKKAVITFSLSDDNKLKISSRGHKALCNRGLDLNHAMKEAAKAVSGVGGGHNVAAGATIPADRKQEFLSICDRIVGDQFKGLYKVRK